MTVKLSDFRALHDNRHNVMNEGCPWCRIEALEVPQRCITEERDNLHKALKAVESAVKRVIYLYRKRELPPISTAHVKLFKLFDAKGQYIYQPPKGKPI